MAVLLTVLVAACASPPSPMSAISVPEKLRPAAGESLARISAARGVQIYECRARKDRPGAYEWAFVTSETYPVDGRGREVVRQDAVPHSVSVGGGRSLGA